METDPKAEALRAAYEALLCAKPYLNARDPVEREVWGALDHAVLAIQTMPPLLR